MALTPAAARLKDSYLELLCIRDEDDRWNAMASVALNVDGVDALDKTVALAGVLKGEFPLVSADDGLWLAAAGGMIAKLEGLGYHLTKEEDQP